MKKATLASLMIVGALTAANSATLERWNWSSSIKFTAKTVESPSTVAELSSLIKETRKNIRVVGTAHSFSDIADTDGTHITLEKFQDIKVESSALSVTFGAGVTYT